MTFQTEMDAARADPEGTPVQATFCCDRKGLPMPTCPDRERLAIQYSDAVVIFSASKSRLKGCNGNGNGFADEQRIAELAQQHAENTRIMLELHRAAHDCEAFLSPGR